MTRLHEGLDYLLYRIYIWGGIAAMVIYFGLVIYFLAVLEVMDVPDTTLLAILMGPVSLWILGILAYWWWVFLFKGNTELVESVRKRPESTPEISALKSWSTLHTAMAIYGGDVSEILEEAKAARRPVLIWYGMQNFLVLWVLGGFWVWVFAPDDLPVDIRKVMAFGVVGIIILFLVVTPFLVGKSIKGGEAAYLAPLGLTLAEPPSDKPYLSGILSMGQALIHEGATVLSGSRRGRPVHVETLGKRSYTLVQAGTPPFEIHSQAGKLVADKDAPEAVIEALRGLRKAKRWRGVEATGGPEGIGIERESPGQNMWLYDLWLIERLLESIENRA
jgi:hypothetical protein